MNQQATQESAPQKPAAGVRFAAARHAQTGWAARPVAQRLAVIAAARRRIAADPARLAATVERPDRSVADTLAMELLPLLDQMRFLERRAATALAPRRPSRRDRPLWMRGIDAEIRRDPFGLVLILAPSNYPLLLAGAQAVQALVAGNTVAVKPAPGCSAPAEAFRQILVEAGLPEAAFIVLGEEIGDGEAALAASPDKVLLTGSAATGRAVLRACAERLIPTVMELSGNDAAILLPGADAKLAAAAIIHGFRLNNSHSCIAPRRVFVHRTIAEQFVPLLEEGLEALPSMPVDGRTRARMAPLLTEAVQKGAVLSANFDARAERMGPLLVARAPDDSPLLAADLFAPVLSARIFDELDEVQALVERSPFALGASVFGPHRAATEFARRLRVGVVTVNDTVVPTVDPRVPFGGRRDSGFGTTRGIEGLLELTVAKTVLVNRARFRPHYRRGRGDELRLFSGLIRLLHAGSGRRKAIGEILRALFARVP